MSEEAAKYVVPTKRERSVKIRLSDEELATLKMHCNRVELARWMRELCLSNGQPDLPLETVHSVDPELIRQLAALGNNLNQISRSMNNGSWGALEKVQILAALGDIEHHLKMLRYGQ